PDPFDLAETWAVLLADSSLKAFAGDHAGAWGLLVAMATAFPHYAPSLEEMAYRSASVGEGATCHPLLAAAGVCPLSAHEEVLRLPPEARRVAGFPPEFVNEIQAAFRRDGGASHTGYVWDRSPFREARERGLREIRRHWHQFAIDLPAVIVRLGRERARLR